MVYLHTEVLNGFCASTYEKKPSNEVTLLFKNQVVTNTSPAVSLKEKKAKCLIKFFPDVISSLVLAFLNPFSASVYLNVRPLNINFTNKRSALSLRHCELSERIGKEAFERIKGLLFTKYSVDFQLKCWKMHDLPFDRHPEELENSIAEALKSLLFKDNCPIVLALMPYLEGIKIEKSAENVPLFKNLTPSQIIALQDFIRNLVLAPLGYLYQHQFAYQLDEKKSWSLSDENFLISMFSSIGKDLETMHQYAEKFREGVKTNAQEFNHFLVKMNGMIFHKKENLLYHWQVGGGTFSYYRIAMDLSYILPESRLISLKLKAMQEVREKINVHRTNLMAFVPPLE